MSPLSIPGTSDDADNRVSLKQNSSSADVYVLPGDEQHKAAVGSVPASPASQLEAARSVSFSSAAACACEDDNHSAADDCCEEPPPGSPRTTEYDGLPGPQTSSPRPMSPSLKLHVATVLRATAAAQPPAEQGTLAPTAARPQLALCVNDGEGKGVAGVHGSAGTHDGTGLSMGFIADSPVASPRGGAVLGVAAAADVPLPDDDDAGDDA